MKILLLGPTPEKLSPCIQTTGDQIVICNEKIDRRIILNNDIDILISYNYRFIIKEEVLSSLNFFAINLHTSFLPFNRGAHPVLWSILDRTPLGATIHQIDNGLDTGPILIQTELDLGSVQKTLRQTYEYVNEELLKLFSISWKNIRNGRLEGKPQIGSGTIHRSDQGNDFLSTLSRSWDTTIEDARIGYVEYLNKAKSTHECDSRPKTNL